MFQQKVYNPYLKVSAAYSFGMLLYYLLHVIWFKRNDPLWLQDAYYIIYSLPAIVALKYVPDGLNEHTFRHFLRTSFYILIFFNIITMITAGDYPLVKRWVSAIIMLGIPLSFVALFLKVNYNKNKQL